MGKKAVENPLLVIVNKSHPHYGESGRIKLNENGKVTVKNLFGTEMIEIELISCKHGVNGCFIKRNDVRVVEG